MCTNLMLSVPSVVNDATAPPIYASARAMEMPGVIEQSLYVMPKGQQWPLPASPSATTWVTNPYVWTSTIDFVGIAASGTTWQTLPNFCDGLNTSGLSVGALWLEPGTDYPQAADHPGPQVSSFDFPAWILGTCSTIQQVIAAIRDDPPTFTVVGPPNTSKAFRPLHYIVTDATGASVIVEFTMEETIVYESSNAAMTNAPTYDWQTTNVTLYENLTLQGGATNTTGEGPPLGSSLLGLPGDSLSASRFIRAWYLSQGFGELPPDGTNWLPAPGGMTPANAPEGYSGPEQTLVVVAMQLVQICMGTPYGMLLQAPPAGSPSGTYPTVGDYTMWTCVRDHTNLNYYVVPAFSAILTKIDLDSLDFAGAPPYPGSPTLAVLPQPDQPWCVDVTDQLLPAVAPT